MTEDKLNPAHPLNGDESTFNDATIAPDHSAIDTSGTDRAVVSAPNIDPSAAKKNYTMTAAHKAKLSAAMKARHSRQKMESVPATVTDTPEICFRPSNANVDCNVLAIAAPVEVFGSGTPTKPEPLSDLSTSEPMSPKTTAEITADLLVQCFKWIRRYAVVSEDQAVIMAAWVLHTFAFCVAEMTPYLHITAPERACGKSTLMDVLVAIAADPVRSGGVTPAALVNTIDRNSPTFFLDEMDARPGSDKDYAGSIRGILNEGYRKGGVFTKCVSGNEVRAFNVFCPKCFAGIGRLPGTVASRSIIIEMRRKLPSEEAASLRHGVVATAAAPIKDALEAWASQSTLDSLRGIIPAHVAGLDDRQNDIAEPLLAIAQLAGDDWQQKLTSALQVIFKSQVAANASTGSALLTDIRAVFDQLSVDKISSKSLAKHLGEIEGRDWAKWGRGTRQPANELAKQLKKYGIAPRGIRIGNDTPKGYLAADFKDAWERYS